MEKYLITKAEGFRADALSILTRVKTYQTEPPLWLIWQIEDLLYRISELPNEFAKYKEELK